MIYFVRNADGTGPIKIGTTIRLSRRLNQLSREWGARMQVLGVMEGGRAEEKALHERFMDLRLEGEWFKPGLVLLGCIDDEADYWDGKDEIPLPDLKLVQVDRGVIAMARFIAEKRGLSLAEYLSEFLRPGITREFTRESRKVEAGDKPIEG